MMNWWKRLLNRAPLGACRRKRESDLDRELSDHLDLEAEHQEECGLSPDAARHAAQRVLGNTVRIKEDVREVWTSRALQQFSQDVRYAVRGCFRNPGFTIVVLLTLSVAIGVNSAVFSIVQSVLLQPLPYKQADRIVRLVQTSASSGDSTPQRVAAITTDDLQQWRVQGRTLVDMAAFLPTQLALHESNQSIPVKSVLISPTMFRLLGAEPQLGRTLEQDEEKQGNSSVAVISQTAWHKYLGGKVDVLGSRLNLQGSNYTVVGVMPSGFQFPDRETEFWLPLVLSPTIRDGNIRAITSVPVLARLADGVSIEAAASEANAVFRGLHSNDNTKIELVRIQDELVAPIRRALIVLTIAVAFVLFIACANISSLLLARAARRQAEIAIRTALGAARSRLIRQLLTESLLLAIISGVPGTLLAFGGIHLITRIGTGHIPRIEEIRMSPPVFMFTFAISILTGILFGVMPAFSVPRINRFEAIQKSFASGSMISSLFGGNRKRTLLTAAEIAMATILLVGAGLLISSFLKLSKIDWGYETENLLVFRIDFDQARYPGFDAQTALFEQLLRLIQTLPNVRSAAVTSSMPLVKSGAWVGAPIVVEGQPNTTRPDDFVNVDVRVVSSGYDRTMSMRLIEGRSFNEHDRRGQPPVILVNRKMAGTYFQNQSAIGKKVHLGEFGPALEIIGILDDVRYAGLDSAPGPELYLNLQQAPALLPAPPAPPGAPAGVPVRVGGFGRGMRFAVRTSADPLRTVGTIRGVIGLTDSQLIVDNIATIEQSLETYVARPRFYAVLMGIFSVIALIVAAVGIYGLVAYSVGQRTREIGIRVAVGAGRAEVMWLVLRQGLLLAGIGVTAGIAGALGLTHYLKNMLFGLTATDPLTFLLTAGIVSIVVAAACYVPARRAMQIDPVIALRHE